MGRMKWNGEFEPRNHAPVPPPPRPEAEVMASWSQGNEPEVSFCCATFNHAPYLRDTIHGFLAQVTTFPFEIIIRDDASTDGTSEIVREYAERYPRIIRPIIEPKNTFARGIKPGRALYKEVRGRYIALCEGDDYWLDPQKIQRQRDLLEARPEASCTFHDTFTFDETGILATSGLNPTGDHRSLDMMMGRCLAHTSAILFRRFPVEVICPPEGKLVPFGDKLRYSILGQYGPAVFISDILPSAYRIHNGGIWSGCDMDKQSILHTTSCHWIAEYYARRNGDPRVIRAWRAQALAHLRHRVSAKDQCLIGIERFNRALVRIAKTPQKLARRMHLCYNSRMRGGITGEARPHGQMTPIDDPPAK